MLRLASGKLALGSTDVRKRVLITAYHYDSAYSMESRLTWQRAQRAAEQYDVTVLCQEANWPTPRGANEAPVATIAVPHTRGERALMRRGATYYFGYRRWQRRVYQRALELHGEQPFDLVHHVSFCGYREPGDCWKLDVPFVWGPVGGTAQFPIAYLSQVGFAGGAKEVVRNAINALQLRIDPRVRRAAEAADHILAANQAVAATLERHSGVRADVQLETGVEAIRSTPRPPRDLSEPLKILWAGRLRPWKGLPILLRALAELSGDCRYVLRVLGEGPCRRSWARLAKRLGVAQHVEWAGWTPPLADQLPHYDWADVFAFTSLRDTSGTGLVEALAAGAPILGLDHQGAADVMSDESCVRIAATSPRRSIAEFRDAIVQLARDPARHAAMSVAALRRAEEFTWRRQWESTRSIYERAIRDVATSRSLNHNHAASAGRSSRRVAIV